MDIIDFLQKEKIFLWQERSKCYPQSGTGLFHLIWKRKEASVCIVNYHRLD